MELNVELRPSRTVTIFLLLVHCFAALAPWLSSLPWWGALSLDVILLLSLHRSIRRYRWVGERRLVYGSGCWSLIEKGMEERLVLIGESFVHPCLLVLRFRSDSGIRTLVLPPDSAGEDELRRLRQLLRFGLKAC